mmetsp:Transcript_130359/g.243893  ORF Transcript_130359/g.243893 Transcript_130359/m.243893 type:complete len:124 (-) Transcript_130359:342-713(-)
MSQRPEGPAGKRIGPRLLLAPSSGNPLCSSPSAANRRLGGLSAELRLSRAAAGKPPRVSESFAAGAMDAGPGGSLGRRAGEDAFCERLANHLLRSVGLVAASTTVIRRREVGSSSPGLHWNGV